MGVVVREWYSSIQAAASISPVPPTSPIRAIASVSGSVSSTARASRRSVPGRMSPPTPIHRLCPRPARVVEATAGHRQHQRRGQHKGGGVRDSTLVAQGSRLGDDANPAGGKTGQGLKSDPAPTHGGYDARRVWTDEPGLGLCPEDGMYLRTCQLRRMGQTRPGPVRA